ncbi:MAG TPA: hypothetical protein VMI92_03195 [Steroidobacteraceae bacterium]|nr:hypothetical protein [Steroidobacteraceae bacterium]
MKIAFWPTAALCICSVHALAADEPAPPGQTVVKTAGLGELRKAMNKAQDRFLDLYNKVNRNAEQRLSCSDDAPTGTRLTQRQCSTRAETRETEEQARNFLGAVATINADEAQRNTTVEQATNKAQAGAPLTSEETAALAGNQAPVADVDTRSGEAAGKVSEQAHEFAENLQKLLDGNPELRRRYEEFLAARQHYQEAGGRP